MKRLNVAVFVSVMALSAVLTAQAQDMAAGKAVYAKKCQTCHAADGNGNAAMGKALKIEFKALGAADVQKKTDVELKKMMTDGMGKMKGVAGLTAAEANDILAYVRSMKK